uniref:Uncharacterized protein n=1 Tax=Heterorhabditis bacteriophora TaxID=37862 RepID=A0A1I7X2J6_HETBA
MNNLGIAPGISSVEMPKKKDSNILKLLRVGVHRLKLFQRYSKIIPTLINVVRYNFGIDTETIEESLERIYVKNHHLFSKFIKNFQYVVLVIWPLNGELLRCTTLSSNLSLIIPYNLRIYLFIYSIDTILKERKVTRLHGFRSKTSGKLNYCSFQFNFFFFFKKKFTI